MRFKAGELYKLIELRGALVIMHAHDNVTKQNKVDLVIADMQTICEYLLRYIEARQADKIPSDAHRIALKGAVIVTLGDFDKPAEKKTVN